MSLATFADCHGWLPLLRGTDGLTGRERRLSARMHRATVGSMTLGKIRAENQRLDAAIDRRVTVGFGRSDACTVAQWPKGVTTAGRIVVGTPKA